MTTAGPSRPVRSRATAARHRLEPVSPTSIVERVSRELRMAVLAGRLRPGQTFSITQLCAELGVSHIPVREALRRLEVQGLVELRPGRSGVVTPLSLEDLDEIYLLRTAIESELIKVSAPLYTDEDLEVLEQILEDMELEVGDTQSDDYWLAHNAFHWQLLEPAAANWSARTLNALWHANERYTRLFYSESGRSLEDRMAEHRRLLEAAKRRSASELNFLLKTHLHASHEYMRKSAAELLQR